MCRLAAAGAGGGGGLAAGDKAVAVEEERDGERFQDLSLCQSAWGGECGDKGNAGGGERVKADEALGQL